MQPTHSGMARSENMTKDMETWVANSLATLLSVAAVVLGVIGLLVAFGYLNGDNSVNHFQDGMVWLVLGLITGIVANVFRREHHVVDAGSGRFSGSSGYSGADDASRTGGHMRQ